MRRKDSIIYKIKKLDLIKEYLNPKVIVQFKRYLISGISAFAIEYLIFRLLLDIISLQKFLSNSIAMFIGFWFSFLLNRFWSFESKENFFKQFSLYSILFLVNLGISNILMLVFSDMFSLQPSISKIIIMCMIVAWNFILFKKIIFRNRK